MLNSTDIQTFLTSPSLKPLRTHLDLSDVKILIVDDCDENQFLFSQLLKRKGAVISTANNGHEGVEKALAESFDVILMDIQMPVMDGYEALELLKKAHCLTPVVAVTATTQTEEKTKMFEAGFVSYASKPLDKEALIQIISNLVENKKNSL